MLAMANSSTSPAAQSLFAAISFYNTLFSQENQKVGHGQLLLNTSGKRCAAPRPLPSSTLASVRGLRPRRVAARNDKLTAVNFEQLTPALPVLVRTTARFPDALL